MASNDSVWLVHTVLWFGVGSKKKPGYLSKGMLVSVEEEGDLLCFARRRFSRCNEGAFLVQKLR